MCVALFAISLALAHHFLPVAAGVRSAMPGYIAKKLCPELIILPCRFEAYKDASRAMRDVLARYDPNFTAYSLDEACLDLTDYLEGFGASTGDCLS